MTMGVKSEFFKALGHMIGEAQNHTQNSTNSSLKDLERQLCNGIRWCAVNKCATQGITNHHNNSTYCNANPTTQRFTVREESMRAQGNDHCLKSVCHKRDKHRSRIEEKVSQECTYTAHSKGSQRIKQNCRGTDNNIVHVQMPTRHGYSKGTQRDIHCQKQPCDSQPKNWLSLTQRFCLLQPCSPHDLGCYEYNTESEPTQMPN